MTVLTTTTGLTHKLTFNLTGIANRFAIGYLRLTDIGLDIKLATHPVYQNIQMQLAHTRDNGLTCLFIRFDTEGGVFLGKLA